MDHLLSPLLLSLRVAIVASILVLIIGVPLAYVMARAAFRGIERELEEIARLMGAGPISVFWHVSLPMARRGIASGLLLAFARALGEFGATLMVFGIQEHRRTLPVSIY